MMNNLVPILIPLAFFATAFGVVYVFFTTRNKERMALIEKGMDASMLITKDHKNLHTFKLGILSIGVSIGLLIGHALNEYAGFPEQISYWSMILLFGGLSFVFFYFKFEAEKKNLD